jgi:hypothetical protein
MACARNIGLSNLPIVVVNVDGYYEPFKQMLDRAYIDELIKLQPENIVHFVPTAEDAVRWVEEQGKAKLDGLQPKLRKRESALRRSSFMDSPSIADWFRRNSSSGDDASFAAFVLPTWTIPFVAGLAIGASLGIHALRKS